MSTTTDHLIVDSGNDADPIWPLHLDAGGAVLRTAARAPELPRTVVVDGIRYVPNGFSHGGTGSPISYAFVRQD